MNINDLIANVKKKLRQNIIIENVLIEDKTFLHKNHTGHDQKKFHLKIEISSKELKNFSKIDGYKKIYKILDYELKNNIHSLQIIIN